MPILSRGSPVQLADLLAHVKEHKRQVGCSIKEGRPGAKDSSKVCRGSDLTGKGWSPVAPEQGWQRETCGGGNHPKSSSKSPGTSRQVHDHKEDLRLSQEVKAARQGQDQQTAGLTIAGFSFMVSSVKDQGQGPELKCSF